MTSSEEVAIFDQFWGTYQLSEKRIYNYLKRHPEDEYFKELFQKIKQHNKSRKK